MEISIKSSKKFSTNYLRHKDYYLKYARTHWSQYYDTNHEKILAHKRSYYRLNKSKILKNAKEYSKKNIEKKKIYNANYRSKNIERLKMHDREYYWSNINKIKNYRMEHSKSIALRRNEYKNKIREEVLTHYSKGTAPKCLSCGKKNPSLLTIDHINENGSLERKKLGKKGGIEFYLWLKKNKFPLGYQVLCYNCNWIKRYRKKETARSRYSQKIKVNVLEHYSKKSGTIACLLCGEDKLELLTIDHIDGGGHREQQNLGLKGTEYYRYLIKQNYPPRFRILCMNCNVLAFRNTNTIQSAVGA